MYVYMLFLFKGRISTNPLIDQRDISTKSYDYVSKYKQTTIYFKAKN